MELKEFLKNAVNEAMDAIVEVNKDREAVGKMGKLNPKIFDGNEFEIDTIEFDIAITVADKKEGGTSGGIKVLAVEFGADGKMEKSQSAVSRVKFSLGVAWPFASITDAKKLVKPTK